MKTLLAFLVLCSTAWSQITVPAESEPYKIIEAKVTAPIPPGAVLDGGWDIPEAADHRQVNANMIYMVAPPGDYQLKFGGFWIHLGPEITVKDVNGVEQTFRPYLGHGLVNEEATFKVTGADPPDPPTPDPAPIALDGLRVMIVRESGQPLTAAQQAMINSTVWKESVGHGNWMVVDPDMVFRVESPWKDAMEATVNYGVPRILVSNSNKGGYVGALPANLNELTKLIEAWAGD